MTLRTKVIVGLAFLAAAATAEGRRFAQNQVPSPPLALSESSSVSTPTVIEASSPSPTPSPEVQTEESATPPGATLDLEWELVPEAISYEIKLVPKSIGAHITFHSEENRLSQRVPLGTYSLQIRSKDKRSGHYGKWSAPTEIEVISRVVELVSPEHLSEIAEPKAKKHKVRFEWLPATGAKRYTLRIWSHETEKILDFPTSRTSMELMLPTARVYSWQVTFDTETVVNYQSDPQTFMFTLLGPQLVAPTVDPKSKGPPATQALWSASPGAQVYDAKLLGRALDEEQWQPIAEIRDHKEISWPLSGLKPGAYRIEVVARAKSRVSSEPGHFEFVVKPTEVELETALKTADPAPATATPSAPSTVSN